MEVATLEHETDLVLFNYPENRKMSRLIINPRNHKHLRTRIRKNRHSRNILHFLVKNIIQFRPLQISVPTLHTPVITQREKDLIFQHLTD